MEYLPRVIDQKLKNYLNVFGAVLVEGPKYSGKTRTCIEYSKTQIYLQNPSDKKRFDEIVDLNPQLLLKGDYPILLDEWQDYPSLWDTVRFEVDQKQIKGGFLLTGSSQSRNIKTMHSGTGRIGKLLLRPMSLYESKYTQTHISLKSLFEGETFTPMSCNLTQEDYMDIMIKGGFPGSLNLTSDEALIATNSYVDELTRLNITNSKNKRLSSTITLRFLQSISRNILRDFSFSKLLDEVTTNQQTLTQRTLYNYYEKLKNYFIIEDLEAWNTHIRSRARLVKSPKRNFIDPVIAIGALNLSKDALINDLNYYGFLFESMCIRDFRILSDPLEGSVFFYGDHTNLDIDAIIQLKDGRWGAIQVKVGSGKIDQACEELHRFMNKLNFNKIKKPSFIAVVTATKDAYTRKDGIHVIPLGLLKP